MKLRTKNKQRIRKELRKLLGLALMVILLLGSSLSVPQRTNEEALKDQSQNKLLGVAYLSEMTVSGGSSFNSPGPAPKDGSFTGIYELRQSDLYVNCPPAGSSYPRW